MANTLRIALILIGTILIGFGVCAWLFPDALPTSWLQMGQRNKSTQFLSMIAFGFLALLGGIAYKRR